MTIRTNDFRKDLKIMETKLKKFNTLIRKFRENQEELESIQTDLEYAFDSLLCISIKEQNGKN